MENHENDEPEGYIAYDIWTRVEGGLFYGPIFVVLGYILGFAQNDPWYFQAAAWWWSGLAVILPPFIVWRIGLRRPPGDRWRSAAILSYGALPCALLVVPDTWFSTLPGLQITMPFVVIWGLACQWFAMRRTAPREPPRVRALILAGGSLLSGAVALAAFGISGLGFLMGVWDPPEIAWLASPLAMVIFVPFGIATGNASLKMLGEAHRAWRQTPEATPAD